MRKVTILGIMVLTLMALVALPVISSADCGKCPSKSTCMGSKVSATDKDKVDHCAGHEGECAFKTISIKGMTCTGCEDALTKTLRGTEGVLKVISISHKTGTAEVCIDPSKVKDDVLTKAIVDQGYKAEIVPAVAKMSESASKDAKKACSPGCSAKCSGSKTTGKSCGGK